MLFFTFGQSLLDYFLFTLGQSFFTTENSSKGTGNSLHIFLSRNRPALKKATGSGSALSKTAGSGSAKKY